MNDDVFITIIKTILQSLGAISILFILTRLMGKKQISQLTFFDYVAGISIGSLTKDIATVKSSEILPFITSIIVFAFFPIILSYISRKSYFARKLLDGVPTILVQNGKIVEGNLKKAKLTINDLLDLLRVKNAFNINDVEFAILETNGNLSVELIPSKNPATPSDLNITAKYQGICTNVIIDGNIIHHNLKAISKDINWLNNELQKQNIHSVSDVLLASLDNNNVLYIDKKNNDPIIKNI